MVFTQLSHSLTRVIKMGGFSSQYKKLELFYNYARSTREGNNLFEKAKKIIFNSIPLTDIVLFYKKFPIK